MSEPAVVEILIVENSPTQALKLRHVLSRNNYRATVARTGGEALAALDRSRPAMVLSALVMPDMDGYQLCRRIKAREDLAGVTVILLTPLADPEEIVGVLECGADNFVAKTYDEGELLSRLEEIRAGGGRSRTQAPEGARLLDLLLSAYDTAVRQNRALRQTREAAALPADKPSPAPPEMASEEPPLDGQKRRLRILLAEDSMVNRRLALHVLGKQGHAVTAAENGREALALFATQPFDLILMDVEMPEMDGFQATAAIRERGERVPIIAMTAHTGAADRERCLARGMDGYVSKPLRAEDLLAVIEDLLPAEETPARRASQATLAFDPDEALERVGGDRELLGEILELFFDETPGLLRQIRQSLAEGDAKTLERAAHSLKGSVGAFGARAAAEAAQNLETAARGQDLAGAAAALAMLEPETARLVGALRAWRNEDGKG